MRIRRDNGFDRNFVEIYESLFSMIFRIAFRVTGDVGIAEDICHETFIKFYERGRLFPDANQTKYWLIRVAKNVALNSEKRKTRERDAFARLTRLKPAATRSSEDEFIEDETVREVQQALNLLPSKLRVVLVLKEYEGLTYKEIASIMGITEGNVKVRVFRGREKLEKIFESRSGDVS
jgi:RNA polymerase sigma-70 factor (ECF subfamily)